MNTHIPVHATAFNDTAIRTSAPNSISEGGDSAHSNINKNSTNPDTTTNRNSYYLTTKSAKYNPEAHAQAIAESASPNSNTPGSSKLRYESKDNTQYPHT